MVIINIDTTKDPPEEIRKTIRYLQTLVGDAPVGEGQPSPKPEPLAEFGGIEIFSDEASPSAEKADDKGPDAERLLKEADELKDEEARIEVEDTKDAFIEIVDLEDEEP
jgi:hypothetical protein